MHSCYAWYAWYAPDHSLGHGIFHDWEDVPGYNATISACEKSCEWRLPLHLLQHLDADVADVVRYWDHELACMWIGPRHGRNAEFATTLGSTQSKVYYS